MVRATFTTCDGGIEQQAFRTMDELTDHIKEHHGEYVAVDAKVCEVKDIRQGRENQKGASA